MPKSFAWFTTVLLFCLGLAHAAHVPRSSGGFPSLGFKMPGSVPSSLNGWWSDYKSEIGFLGFSYPIFSCQNAATLQSDFNDMRTRFNSRYVHLEGACDQDGFYNNVVNAAWNASLGVHALIWTGPTGTISWQTRRDSLLSILHTNPKAKFVTRAVQFGSQPLYGHNLSPNDLVTQIKLTQKNLTSLGILVTSTEMVAGYEVVGGAQSVLDAIDVVDLSMLPYSNNSVATTAFNSWVIVQDNLAWIAARANGKKIILSENGWPQVGPKSTGRKSNAVASLQQEQDYFTMFDFNCRVLKSIAGGGVGWFAEVYSVELDPSSGILKGGQPQFPFSPQTSC